MKNLMRKIIAVVLCCNFLMATPVLASSTQVLKSNIYFGSEITQKGAANLFNLNTKNVTTLENINVDNNNLDYTLKIKDVNDDCAEVSLKGDFYINGIQTKFIASDNRVKKTIINNNVILYIGTLTGTCEIDGIERVITVAFEKTDENLYIAMSINKLGSDEGMALIQFGNSIITQELFEEIFNDNDDLISTRASYTYVDSEWDNVINNQTSNTVIKGELYVEDVLVNGGDKGRILANFLYDSNALIHELSVSQSDYIISNVSCTQLDVDFHSQDQEAYFGGHHPDEGQSDSTIATWVANALYDIGVPTYGLSTLIALIAASQEDITVYNDNDLYQRGFRIYLSGSTDYMDWYEDSDGGYCVEVAVTATNTIDDDIWAYGEMELSFFMDDKYSSTSGWAAISTEQVSLSVDLANYK